MNHDVIVWFEKVRGMMSVVYVGIMFGKYSLTKSCGFMKLSLTYILFKISICAMGLLK